MLTKRKQKRQVTAPARIAHWTAEDEAELEGAKAALCTKRGEPDVQARDCELGGGRSPRGVRGG